MDKQEQDKATGRPAIRVDAGLYEDAIAALRGRADLAARCAALEEALRQAVDDLDHWQRFASDEDQRLYALNAGRDARVALGGKGEA